MITVTVVFNDGSKKSIQGDENDNLLDLLRDNGIDIDAPCNGNGSCGKCIVKIIEGDLRKESMKELSKEKLDQGYVLSCMSYLKEDLKIFLPDSSMVGSSRIKSSHEGKSTEWAKYKKMRKKFAESHGEEPYINKMVLKLPEPNLDDNISDHERLKREIKVKFGYKKVKMSLNLLKKLPFALRNNNFEITLFYTITNEESIRIRHLSWDKNEKAYGVAFDIGTTSVAACLVELESGEVVNEISCGNAQSRYGADVINRIIYSTKKDGLKKLKDALINESMNPLIIQLANEADIETEQILILTASANTTMSHLLLGIYPDYLRREPYIPVIVDTHEVTVFPWEMELMINQNAVICISPSVASYVGGDITAGVVAADIRDKPELTALIDLGTNGEIVFGNQDFLMTCACSAGPAFEGGEISCGMRASLGAIEAVTIQDNNYVPVFKIIDTDKPYGLCGSGIIDLISELKRTGLINAKGKFDKSKECERISFDEYGIGRYVLAFKEEYDIDNDIYITEIDIDNFIRAKGAIYSALYVILDSLGFTPNDLDKIKIAGGIGSHIGIKNAINIGIFPDIDLEKYEFIGNSSLSGSYLSLVNRKARDFIGETANQMTYVELSVHPGYMDEFVSACFIPHTDLARFPSHINAK
ncbi:corrinoid activation/regeneration protein AcsV [Alkalibacter mobilis]|uniref:corrinoid activation/regeneration protein AcsV n=1 Tax=Alkalibacter mobilis TaxID=2787712 RepID=UPI00189F122F|nr:corrinoid activation/regeneration protein AcsV [Alkalibacter mobilis]MBF7096899.1 DUF4445 domain-containing protein [Alkalibacter mobilis]